MTRVPQQPRKGRILGSATRRKFMARKRAIRQQRADDKLHAETHIWCDGLRMRGGEKKRCYFEVYVGKPPYVEGATGRCRMCQQLHVFYRTKWYTPQKLKLYREQLEPLPGEEGYEEQGHTADCGYKDFLLIGLRPGAPRTMANGDVRQPWLNAKGRVAHWCRPQAGSVRG